VADIVTVVDSSGSIGEADFEKAKQFLASLVDLLLTASPNNTRIGMVVYGNDATDIFDLNNNLTRSDLNSTILSMRYLAEDTNTPAGLNKAVGMFNNATTRPGVPHILICLTDGNHNRGNLTLAIKEVREANITSLAVGIGTDISDIELLRIALDEPSGVFLVKDFSALYDFVYRMSEGTCDTAQSPEVGEDVTDDLVQLEYRFYVFTIPAGSGLTIRIEVGLGGVNGWYSRSEPNPSSAINDGEIRDGWLYVPYLGGNGKQDGGGDEVVFVSIQGTEDSNEYTISTVEGNQVSTTEPPTTEPEVPTTQPAVTTTTTPNPTTVPSGSNNQVQIGSALLITFFHVLFMCKFI
jgi:hypothetical protein